jgi:hypothetical protein
MLTTCGAAAVQAEQRFANLDVVASGQLANAAFGWEILDIVDPAARIATEVRVRGSHGFVVSTIGAGKHDLRNQPQIAQFVEGAIHRGKAQAVLAPQCELVHVGHGQMDARPLLLHDLMHEAIVFREIKRLTSDGHDRAIVAQATPSSKR